MMQEEVRWISATADRSGAATMIRVNITGWGAQSIREHYDKKEGDVYVVHVLTSGGGAITWSATLWIGDEVVHKEPEGVTTASYTLNEGEKWKTRLTGGHRMIRHLIEVTG